MSSLILFSQYPKKPGLPTKPSPCWELCLKRFSLLMLGIILAVVCAVLTGCIFTTDEPPVQISGRVVSAETNLPVADVMVAVESTWAGTQDGSSLGEYVRTDSSGKFTTMAKGNVTVRAWKPGYAMRDIPLDTSWKLSRREINVKLRELTSNNIVSENNNRDGFASGDGFSFMSGKVVSGDSPDADIRLTTAQGGNELLIEVLGEGGLVYQQYDKNKDFYNTPIAPDSGYSKRLPLPDKMGIFYVITKDGKHYAKIRLIPGGVKKTDHGDNYNAYWLQWSYQPDGTKNLEIAPNKSMPFPFYKFGLKADYAEN